MCCLSILRSADQGGIEIEVCFVVPKLGINLVPSMKHHCLGEYLSVNVLEIPVLREAMLIFVEPRHFAASSYSKDVPRGVCGHLLKPY